MIDRVKYGCGFSSVAEEGQFEVHEDQKVVHFTSLTAAKEAYEAIKGTKSIFDTTNSKVRLLEGIIERTL